jgi:hypothetical protein
MDRTSIPGPRAQTATAINTGQAFRLLLLLADMTDSYHVCALFDGLMMTFVI